MEQRKKETSGVYTFLILWQFEASVSGHSFTVRSLFYGVITPNLFRT